MRVEVYKSRDGEWYLKDKMELIEIIERKPFHRGFLGNFVPHYCRYKGQVYSIYGSIDHAYIHGYSNDAYICIDRPLMKYC